MLRIVLYVTYNEPVINRTQAVHHVIPLRENNRGFTRPESRSFSTPGNYAYFAPRKTTCDGPMKRKNVHNLFWRKPDISLVIYPRLGTARVRTTC